MNVLSLFDGMSCGQIALERAGIKVDNYFASEIDPYAIKITQKNYPNTIQLGDVTEHAHWHLPEIDLIIGGSPCQGFSFSGKLLNFDDPRSKLFFDYYDALTQFLPKYFLLENVRMSKQSRDTISTLLGYEPIEIDSALVSAQSRKRLYWTNIEGVTQPEDKGLLLKDVLEYGTVTKDKSYCIDANYWKGGSYKHHLEYANRQRVLYQSDRRMQATDEEQKSRLLTPLECERLQTVPEGYTDGVSNYRRYKMLGNGWTVDVISHIFSFLPDKYKIGKEI